MQHRAVSSHRSVAFGIVLALAAMALSFLAVLAASVTAQDAAAQTQYAQAASDECATTSDVRTFNGTQNQLTEPFKITGDRFRLAVNTSGGGKLEVAVLNEQAQPTGQRFEVRGDGSKIIPLGPGTFRLELEEHNLRNYSVTVQECRAAVVANTDTTQAITAAQTTAQAANITGAEATTSDTAANAADAGNDVRDADAFRCEFFLRVVRDDRGALRHQYQDDELIVHRFEQCISADVLTDTIPNRLLPGTGGLPLLGLAALGLASIVAGASVLGAGIRRRR
jgi:hypothetical protein